MKGKMKSKIMEYIKVKWIHCFNDEPIWFYSELDEERWEIRKVVVFKDGRLGYIGPEEGNGLSILGEIPMPSLEEIASEPEFEPYEISAKEFKSIWEKAILFNTEMSDDIRTEDGCEPDYVG